MNTGTHIHPWRVPSSDMSLPANLQPPRFFPPTLLVGTLWNPLADDSLLRMSERPASHYLSSGDASHSPLQSTANHQVVNNLLSKEEEFLPSAPPTAKLSVPAVEFWNVIFQAQVTCSRSCSAASSHRLICYRSYCVISQYTLTYFAARLFVEIRTSYNHN